MNLHPSNAVLACILSAAIIVVTAVAYWPGLAGGFLFDDFANLPALGATGPVDNWPAFWRYITSGTNDPAGRPIALLTFLIDANNWPAEPYAFKRTNLVLHLVNAVLLGLLLLQLGRALQRSTTSLSPAPDGRSLYAAILGAALWALHPLLVSTTLYIIQREAMLPATFVLLGLLGWIHARRRLEAGQLAAGWTIGVLSIGGFTMLALFSKANGVLLPLLALVVDVTILQRRTSGACPTNPNAAARMRIARAVMLGVPSAVITLYILAQLPDVARSTPHLRGWTMGERLLTEARIIFQYISLLIVPRPYTTGLYNDQIAVSAGLLAPWTTLPAVVGVLLTPLAAWWIRSRAPALAAAVLFFWTGHLLESSFFALELYYEHRNYLPAMLFFWPLAWWLTSPGKRRVARGALAALLICGVALMTHARANLWGNQQEQALVWAALNPNSPRAQTTAALFEMRAGQAAAAEERLRAALARHPHELQLALNLLGARCQLGEVRPEDLDLALSALREARQGVQLTFKWMNDMLNTALSGSCAGLTRDTMAILVKAAQSNTAVMNRPGRKQELLHLQGRIALAEGQADAALEKFNAALGEQVRPAAALQQAALLGASGFPEHGLRHLARFDRVKQQSMSSSHGMPRLREIVLEKQNYWEHEIQRLQQALAEDAAATASAGSDSAPPALELRKIQRVSGSDRTRTVAPPLAQQPSLTNN